MTIKDIHRKAIRLLVQGLTPDEVGKEIGRKLSTIVLWMLEKPFLREWKKRRLEYVAEATKFSDLSEKVPGVVATILNSQSEQSRLRASEVWMRGLELEKVEAKEKGISRPPADELEEEERIDLLRKGILVGIGEWTFLRERNDMGYEGGVKYWDELNAEELSNVVDRKFDDALKWGIAGGNAIWLGGVKFVLPNPEESRAEWERRAKELLERIRQSRLASKEEIREEFEIMEKLPEPGLAGGDGVKPRKLAMEQQAKKDTQIPNSALPTKGMEGVGSDN